MPVSTWLSSRWPLPATPGDADDLAGVDVERDAVQRLVAVVATAETLLKAEHRLSPTSCSRGRPALRMSASTISRPTISLASMRGLQSAVVSRRDLAAAAQDR